MADKEAKQNRGLSESELDTIARKIYERIKEEEKDPYSLLAQWSVEAMEEFKNDLKKAVKETDDETRAEKIKSIQERANTFQKTVNETIQKMDTAIKADSKKRILRNPFHEEFVKKASGPYRFLPFGKRFLQRHTYSAKNWLGLLLTGTGIVLLWRGIWDGSYAIISNQGSIIIGIAILITMAWLEKRRVFTIFGE